MSVKEYAMVSREKKFQMVQNMDMAKKDVPCAVFLWQFLDFVALVVVLYWEQNRGVENNGQKN